MSYKVLHIPVVQPRAPWKYDCVGVTLGECVMMLIQEQGLQSHCQSLLEVHSIVIVSYCQRYIQLSLSVTVRGTFHCHCQSQSEVHSIVTVSHSQRYIPLSLSVTVRGTFYCHCQLQSEVHSTVTVSYWLQYTSPTHLSLQGET